MASIHKEGALAVDKVTSDSLQGCSAKKPRLDYSRVTKNITDIFAADPVDLTETGTSFTEAPKRILIEGAPGIGKTVLAKEIAYCWATSEILPEIKIVFLLYLRDPQLQKILSTKQLVEYMSMGCIDDQQITVITKYLVNENGQQLCIVMDGFDEYPSALQENSLFLDIIKGEILPEAIVVITSRPTATVSLHDQVDRRIDILGLPQEERVKYISQVFSSSLEKRTKLERYLKQHPVINGLCFVPLHLAVLLYLFQQGSLPETLTEMNQFFILHTIYRHLKRYKLTPPGSVGKLKNLPKPVLDIVYKLSELAFKGLQENKLVFTFDEIKQACPYIDETVGAINGFGLLQAVEHYPHKEAAAGTTKSFNFLHFTMQEFLAALHVSTLPSEEQLPLMKKMFWDGHYNFMWMMFVGIVGINSDIFVSFVSKGKVYINKSGIRMADNILSDKRKRLHVFQCYMEAKSSAEAPDVISGMFKHGQVIINEVKLLPHHISSLMTFMSNSSMQWTTLELSKCNITDVGMNVLSQFISERTSTLEHVNLSHNDSSPWGVYCAIIRHCSVNNLTLGGGYGMEEHVNDIIKHLQMNTTLQSLTLCNVFRNIALIKMVLSHITTLNELNLPCREVTDNQDFNDVKEVLFHTTLQSKCDDTTSVRDNNRIVKVNLLCNKSCDSTSTSNLNSLNASDQCIDDYGVTVIITFCDEFQKIDLSCNKISDNGVIVICDYFKNDLYLLELNLSNNKITNEGAKQIAKAIKKHPVLQNINISKNYITAEGLLYFIEAAKNNYTLQVVNITYNNVIRSGFTSIKQCIENLQYPVQICASYNEISTYGQLISKISKSYAPGNIEEVIWSFKEYDPDHLVMCLSECLKEDDTLQELYLQYTLTTSKQAKFIAEALKVNKTLKKLCIIINFKSDDVIAAISDGFKGNKSLHELNMRIEYSKITNKGAKLLAEAIKVNTILKILHINSNRISDDGVASISDSLKSNNSLQKLHMGDTNITSEGAKKIAEAIKVNTILKILHVNSNRISDDGVASISDSLKSNNSLQELHMGDNNITSEGAKKIAEAVKVNTILKILHINSNRISDDGIASISDSLKSNNSLQELHMGDNNITSEGAKKIAEAIKVNTILKILHINSNRISDDGVASISDSLKSNNSLQKLHMGDTNITSEGAKKIAEAIKVNTILKILHVNSNRISDDGVASISDSLKSNNSLQELHMGDINITSEGAKKIAEAVKVNTILKILHINSNRISDDGVASISDSLKSNNSLQELHMGDNNITSEGAKKIAEAIKVNTILKILHINSNRISDDGIASISDSLKSNNSLQELHMDDNNITGEGAKNIAEAIKVNTTLHTLSITQYNINNALSFNMTVLTAVYHNNTLMKLELQSVYGDDERLVSIEEEKINKERTRQGISTLTCYYTDDDSINYNISS